MPKLLFLIADGMGDWPIEELNGQTPLEAAETPRMDALAHQCVAGTAQTVPKGMAPGSDVANMALIGFDPLQYHTGRGPIEAAAQGVALNPDDLAWRLNLVATSEPNANGTMIDYSSGHIATEDSTPLIEDLQAHLGDDTFEFIPGIQYRHLLVQRGGADSPEETVDIRPPHDIPNHPLAVDFEQYAKAPRLKALYDAAAERLARPENTTKANSIWPWGQGRPLLLPDFAEEFGMRGAVISAVDLVMGLGRASGMEVIDVPGVTGLLDTNYEGKVAATLDFLRSGGDFAYLHIEAPDECGHSGITADKVEAVRRFDSRVVGPVLDALKDEDVAVVITCDHFTPIAKRTHTTDPVPFLLWHPSQTEHALPSFSEANAIATGLHLEQGHTLMRHILDRLK